MCEQGAQKEPQHIFIKSSDAYLASRCCVCTTFMSVSSYKAQKCIQSRIMRSLIIALLIFICIHNTSQADEWCHERNFKYPNGMFGQFEGKMKGSSKQVSRIFKFGKDKLPERPGQMLQGLAYLEVLVNEMCKERTNWDIIRSREKIEKITNDLRLSLGLPLEYSRQRIVNIYWSTGELLKLATVEKLPIDEKRKNNIHTLREAKAALKTALRKAKGND